jgi:hypothetical protein
MMDACRGVLGGTVPGIAVASRSRDDTPVNLVRLVVVTP